MVKLEKTFCRYCKQLAGNCNCDEYIANYQPPKESVYIRFWKFIFDNFERGTLERKIIDYIDIMDNGLGVTSLSLVHDIRIPGRYFHGIFDETLLELKTRGVIDYNSEQKYFLNIQNENFR